MDEFGGEIDEPDGWWLNGIGGGGNEPVLDMYAAFFQGKKSGETRLSYSPLINRETPASSRNRQRMRPLLRM